MTKTQDAPLAANVQRFIHFYVETRDLEKAAQLAGFRPSWGLRMYKQVPIREEIDRRIGVVELEQAKLKAADVILTERILDKELLEIIQLDPKAFAREKLNALKFGYVLQNKVRIGNTEAIVERGPNPGAGNFYRAFETTTTTVREVTAGAPAETRPAPKTIEAKVSETMPPPVETTHGGAPIWKY